MVVTGYAGPVVQTSPGRVAAPRMESVADFKALAKATNPLLGYWDPLNLASWDYFGQGDEAFRGFLRHAEIKHGRVAMAGFVGYCAQANGLRWPGPLNTPWLPAEGLSPPEQWDALSFEAKLQIIGFIGILEIYSEHSIYLEKQGEAHYMRGGKPGFYPKFDPGFAHPVPLNLFDPFGFCPTLSDEQKASKLAMEINNGRAAMLGMFGFVCAAKIPGSVPALSFIPPYSGDFMAPFEGDFTATITGPLFPNGPPHFFG